MKFRKRPVEVEALQWRGDNLAELITFTGGHFALAHGRRTLAADPDATAQVFDTLHSSWVLLRTGDWIVKGTEGECWPVRQGVFDHTYDPITDDR